MVESRGGARLTLEASHPLGLLRDLSPSLRSHLPSLG